MKTLFFAFLLCASFIVVIGQTNSKSNNALIVSPTKFKLQSANITYQGKECSPSIKTNKVYSASGGIIKIDDDTFYEAQHFYQNSRGDGLVVENFSAQTCRIYSMFDLAKVAGWLDYKGSDDSVPASTGGLYRVGNTLWMGSNGIGAAVFDLEKRVWSRYDLKSNVIGGDHLRINYADDSYVFITRGEFPGASLHIYSVKQNKWLGLNAVSTKLVSEYGYTTGLVQVPVDHRFYSRQKYLPIDWTFMGLKVVDKGNSYLFEKNFLETKTVFEVTKSEFERIFKNGRR